MVAPNKVIQDLPPLKWRGLDAPPYDIANVGFTHRQAAFEYPGIDRHFHEWMGLASEELEVQLYFLNSVQKDAFPKLWNDWWGALKDGSPGELEHPLLGVVDAVVQGGKVSLTANVTAGVVVEVTFLRTLIDPGSVITDDVAVAQVVADVVEASEAMAALDPTLPSQAGVTDILDLLNMIEGLIFSTQSMIDGVVNQIKGQLNAAISLLSNLETHLIEYPISLLQSAWGMVDKVKPGANKKKVGAVLLQQDTTLDRFAREKLNELSDIVELNPGALAAPMVSKGTMLRFYE